MKEVEFENIKIEPKKNKEIKNRKIIIMFFVLNLT